MASVLGTLLEAMRDGVVGLDAESQVVYANDAARRRLGRHLEWLPRHEPLRSALARRRHAATGAPEGGAEAAEAITLSLGSGTADQRRYGCTLCPAPTAGMHWLLVHDTGDGEAPPLDNLLAVLRESLTVPLAAFAEEARALDASPALAATAQELAARLDKVAALADVWARHALDGQDRILVPELLADVLRDVGPLAEARGVRIALNDAATALPALYASRDWLRRALVEVFDNAIRHAPLREADDVAAVEFDTRLAGNHVLLRLRNSTQARSVAPGFTPFRPPHRRGGDAEAPRTLALGLPLARRIIELHGGRLRVTAHVRNAGTQVLIELPTGATRRLPELDAMQAQRYAEDFAKLRSRRHGRPPVVQGESR